MNKDKHDNKKLKNKEKEKGLEELHERDEQERIRAPMVFLSLGRLKTYSKYRILRFNKDDGSSSTFTALWPTLATDNTENNIFVCKRGAQCQSFGTQVWDKCLAMSILTVLDFYSSNNQHHGCNSQRWSSNSVLRFFLLGGICGALQGLGCISALICVYSQIYYKTESMVIV